MFDCNQFDDGRGRYPGRLIVHVRRGLRETIGTAASRQGVSAAEWVRANIGAGSVRMRHQCVGVSVLAG